MPVKTDEAIVGELVMVSSQRNSKREAFCSLIDDSDDCSCESDFICFHESNHGLL